MKVGLSVIMCLVLGACGGDSEPPALNGEACVAGETECESGLCVEEFQDGLALADGMCTTECIIDEGGCLKNETCLWNRVTEEAFCFQSCTGVEGECREETEDHAAWSCKCLDFFCLRAACLPEFE